MQILWPQPPATAGTELSDADLERIYAYPETLDRPRVHVNFVRSADGAATVDGHSQALSHPADQRIFALGRDLADVILVGARTVLAEGYAGAKTNERRADPRRRLGLAPVPPIAVVTRRCTIPPGADLLTDTAVPPLIYTCAEAPTERKHALKEAGAEVIECGENTVHLPSALTDLDRRGLRRVDCEGGPHVLRLS
jgi:riboflavin biosynthesis pyrimidine reductase